MYSILCISLVQPTSFNQSTQLPMSEHMTRSTVCTSEPCQSAIEWLTSWHPPLNSSCTSSLTQILILTCQASAVIRFVCAQGAFWKKGALRQQKVQAHIVHQAPEKESHSQHQPLLSRPMAGQNRKCCVALRSYQWLLCSILAECLAKHWHADVANMIVVSPDTSVH